MGWLIAGAVVAVILILLMTSVRVRFDYSDPGELRLRISWLFLTLVRVPAATKKQKRRDKKAEKDVKSAAETAADAEKSAEYTEPSGSQQENKSGASAENKTQKTSGAAKPAKPPKTAKPKSQRLTLSDILALVKLVRDSLGKPLRRLLKATRINGFRLDIAVGGDDAAEAAIKFGKVNMAAGSALAFLDGCFTLKAPALNVTCDFNSEETRTECSFTARLTLIAALAFLLWTAGRLVRNYMSRKDAAAAVDKLRK